MCREVTIFTISKPAGNRFGCKQAMLGSGAENILVGEVINRTRRSIKKFKCLAKQVTRGLRGKLKALNQEASR
jgi:hypothetical protein